MLKVSAKSVPNKVAGALAASIREARAAEVQAIGAGAINQCVKAIAIAHGFLAPEGIEIVCVPAFVEIQLEDEGGERTAIRFYVTTR